jgi:hypothetical protein
MREHDEQAEPDGRERERLDKAVDVEQPDDVARLGPPVPDRNARELERPAEERQRDERDRPGEQEMGLLPPEGPVLEHGEPARPEAFPGRRGRRLD